MNWVEFRRKLFDSNNWSSSNNFDRGVMKVKFTDWRNSLRFSRTEQGYFVTVIVELKVSSKLWEDWFWYSYPKKFRGIEDFTEVDFKNIVSLLRNKYFFVLPQVYEIMDEGEKRVFERFIHRFCCISKGVDKYSIFDIQDGSIEEHSRQSVQESISSGIKIYDL